MALRTLHIGVGGRGIWPVSLFPKRDELKAVGLCDLREEALAKARELTGLTEAACTTDWRRALETTDCDAVVVITPPQLHHEMCLAAVRAGKHVLVEKPFTMDLREAVEVVRAAEQTGARLVVGQQARYAAGNQRAMELLASGEVGRAQFGMITRFSKRPGTHHSGQQRHSYAWERGVHDFDTAWSIFDAPPTQLRCVSFNPSWSPYEHGAGMFAVLGYENGAVCDFNACFMSHRDDNAFVVDCDAGSLTIGASEVVLKPADGGEPVTYPAGSRPQPEAMVVDGWLAWIGGGAEPVTGMHNNLWILATVEAAGVASDEGSVVDVREYLRHRLDA